MVFWRGGHLLWLVMVGVEGLLYEGCTKTNCCFPWAPGIRRTPLGIKARGGSGENGETGT